MNPLVPWTARLCVGCYLLRYLSGEKRAERLCWSAGWLLLAVHTAVAFHFAHDWSHAAAVLHTAEQTEAVTGLYWGGGVWFNYATLLLWCVDAALLWRRPASPRWWSVALQGYLAAMMVSATVVFGPGYWWIVAAWFAVAIVFVKTQPFRAARTN